MKMMSTPAAAWRDQGTRWLVVVVVIYTALSMLRSAASERQSLRKAAQPPALEDVVICPTKAP